MDRATHEETSLESFSRTYHPCSTAASGRPPPRPPACLRHPRQSHPRAASRNPPWRHHIPPTFGPDDRAPRIHLKRRDTVRACGSNGGDGDGTSGMAWGARVDTPVLLRSLASVPEWSAPWCFIKFARDTQRSTPAGDAMWIQLSLCLAFGRTMHLAREWLQTPHEGA